MTEASLDQAEKILAAINAAVLVIGPDHVIRYMNAAAASLVGVEGNSAIGRNCYEVLREGHGGACLRSENICPAHQVFVDGQEKNIVRRLATSGNGNQFCHISASPLFDRQGAVEAVVETVRIIEDAEISAFLKEELRRSNNELQDLFAKVEQAKLEWETTMDCISDMVFLCDSGGRIRRCNRSFIDFIGRPYSDVIGCQWHKLLEESGIMIHAMDVESSVVVHQPSSRFFVLSLYNYGHRDFVGFVISLQDVTEQRRIAFELGKKKDELEAAYSEMKRTQAQMLQHEKMASIGVLAAGVAHEINNPIGFVASNLGTLRKYLDRLARFIDLQQEQLNKSQDEKQHEEIARARRDLKLDFILVDSLDLIAESQEGTARVCKIVQDLKGFSRVDRPERSFANVNELIDSTIHIAWNELKYKVELVREYGELPDIECFPQQLNQVFMNLLVNASQAISDHGVITVRTWAEEDAVGVAIEDTGCGIDGDVLPRIFEPFFTTKEVGKGTGLGLSIVYEIVAVNHGGRIWATSEKGKGSIFTMILPLRPGKGVDLPPAGTATETPNE